MSEEEDLEALILGQISAEEERRISFVQDLEKIVTQNKKLGLSENAEDDSAGVDNDAPQAVSDNGLNAQALNSNEVEPAEFSGTSSVSGQGQMAGMDSMRVLPSAGYEGSAPITAPSALVGSADKGSCVGMAGGTFESREEDTGDNLLGKISQGDNANDDLNLAVPAHQGSINGAALAEPEPEVVGRVERRREKNKVDKKCDNNHKEKNKGAKDTEDTILGFEIDDSSEVVDTAIDTEYELCEASAAPEKIQHPHKKKIDKKDDFLGLTPEKKAKKHDNAKAPIPENRPHKEKAKKQKKHVSNTSVSKLFQVLLTICLPIIIVWLSFRLVASSLFISLEFSRLGPAQGLDSGARQRFADYALGYLSSNADRSYLEDLRLGDAAAFTSNEISHMFDVKNIITAFTYAMFVAAVMAIICIIILNISDRRALAKNRVGGAVRRAFFYGAILTLVLIALAVLFVVLNWQGFFTGFHEYLFPQGNWQFDGDSLLIRLFPEHFWRDAAVMLCILTVLISLVIIVSNWPRKKKHVKNHVDDGSASD